MKKILFLCTGNSCRSQMAEGWGKKLMSGRYEFYSAGIKTHGLNPKAVFVMKEENVNISNYTSKNINALKDINFDVVFTVCGHADETCPAYLKKTKIIHVGFDDPPKLEQNAKSEEEALEHYRRVRDEIKNFISNIDEHIPSGTNYLASENFNLFPNKVQIFKHKPKILILYGSLRKRSYSRLLAEEAGQILTWMGAEVKFYNPDGLPTFDYDRSVNHQKVQELRELSLWSEGHVWSSPEVHGNMAGLIKTQIDWIPLSLGSVRPTQGRTLALMQVSGGSQSFNAINNMRILGRWMRMITIPNQSSVAKAYQEFNDDGTMKESSYRDRVVDVMEELMRFTFLTREYADFLVDRYSERKDKNNKTIKAQKESP